MLHLYNLRLISMPSIWRKVPIEKVPNQITSSNDPPKNQRCKQFGNAVSDIVASYLLKFLWAHVEIHPTCVLAYQLVWFPRSFVKYYADPVFNPLFQIKRSTPRCSQADIKTFHFWNHKLFWKPALIFVWPSGNLSSLQDILERIPAWFSGYKKIRKQEKIIGNFSLIIMDVISSQRSVQMLNS